MPDSVLKTYPKLTTNPTSAQKEEWNDFITELYRVKELVNRVPDADPHRLLELACLRLQPEQRKEFIALGNHLLVNITHMNIIIP